MLAVAGALAILVGEVRDGLLVLFGLLPIVGADVVTEYRGERALEALRAASAPVARIRRGGAVSVIPAAELVTGDVVLLSGGDVVPADMRITRSERLLLDRSVLTGESVPEPGRVEPDPALRAPGRPACPRLFGHERRRRPRRRDRRGHGPRHRGRANCRQPGVSRTAPQSVAARTGPPGADPAGGCHRVDRLRDRALASCADIRWARTSSPASRPPLPRYPRSHRCCWP